jgi:biotin carboxyl carrier protein
MIKVQVGQYEAKEFSAEDLKMMSNELDIKEFSAGNFSILKGAESHEIRIQSIDKEKKIVYVNINGKATSFSIKDKMDLLLEKLGFDTTKSTKMNQLKAPMPGLVIEYFVKEGDEVQAGDKLMILEAMKMENVIKATGEGKIKKLVVTKGNTVEKNQLLIEFE